MKKILIIEDDLYVRTSIVDILEGNDYKVFSVADGKAGISLANEIELDLIVCDIMMPGLDGYEVFEELNKNEKTALIPFIFLTAKADLKDVTKGLGMGADDYIVKPFKAKELLNRVYIRLEKLEKLKNSFIEAQLKGAKENNNIDLNENSNILLTVNNKPKFLKLNSIICITAQGEYCKVFLQSGKNLFIRKLLKQWEEYLPCEIFKRVHRSTIININYIEKIEKWAKRSYVVHLKNVDQNIVISERYSSKLKKELSF